MRAIAVLALLVSMPAGAGAAPLELDLEVAEQMVVDGCGGFTGGCREFRVEGTMTLSLDAAAGTASLPVADLRVGEEGQPGSLLELPLGAISGTFDGTTIRLTTAAGSLESLDWTMTLTAGGLVLQGVFDEGCCDRFVYTFRNVAFAVLGDDAPPPTVLRLGGGRFTVQARWTDFAGEQGPGRAVELNEDSGTFWFFSPDNTELVVKVLDGCEIFGTFWFFAAGLTDVGVELTVRDLVGERERRYESPVGRAFQPILDTAAFRTCEPAPAP